MTIDFGKSHWLLFGVSFFGFIALAYVVGIGPAIWVQNHTQPLPGSVAPTALETEGLKIYISEGCVYCHTQQVRPLKMDGGLGKALGPWRLRLRAAGWSVATVRLGHPRQ